MLHKNNNKPIIGYAPVINIDGFLPYLKQIYDFGEVSSDACEISTLLESQLDIVLKDLDKLSFFPRTFKYKSLHAPAVDLVYAPYMDIKLIEKLNIVISELKIDLILFHPDVVADIPWLIKQFKINIAFENMDVKKKFGTSVSDLKKVFKQAPSAFWVFDVNHAYSIDPTMNLAKDLFDNFKDRLAHYHLSGYKGFHCCLSESNEIDILLGIQDLSKPIIHEGGAGKNKELLIQEHNYVINYFNSKKI